MRITSKHRRRLWGEIKIEERNAMVTTDVGSINEAQTMIEELNSVIQDLEQYIEDKTPKTE